ncbi:MerR family transcriptional regulator [Streptomyces sp. NPDC015346]|uniref:MerR family transcriptional regulator n=1 Tax=Streptomyces sp. NPDC015346 TaxID=3364954 RepID=UPI0036F5F93D
MRLSELSRTSGVPAPTIKFYLREGLLSPGVRTNTNQARYGPGHLHRLRLIRALLDIGGLSLAEIGDVLAASAGSDTGLGHLPRAARQPALGTTRRDTEPRDTEDAHATDEVLALVQRQGWLVSPGDPAVEAAAEALAALLQLGRHDFAERLDTYAAAADTVAASDVGGLDRRTDPARATETLIVGNVLGERLLAALRRLALTHHLRGPVPLVGDTTPA